MHNRTLLITGCARSGTTYITTVLRAAGLDVGHAYVGSDGTVSHWWASPAVRCPLLVRKEPLGRCAHVGEQRGDFAFAHVWHQVRHPLAVIASVARVGMPWAELSRAFPLRIMMHRSDPLELAMRYCLAWNALCEAQAEWRYRVEDVDLVFPEMCYRLGLPEQSLPNLNASPSPPPTVTYAGLARVNAEQAERVYDLAVRYGYG